MKKYKSIICALSILLVLFIITTIAVIAKDVLDSRQNTFLYIYANTCKNCLAFNSNFKKLEKKYGAKYRFIALDADERDGAEVMYNLRARYVPFVLLFDNKTFRFTNIPPFCLQQFACVDDVTSRFLN